MSKIALVSDSVSDLSAAQFAEWDVEFIPHIVLFGDEMYYDQVEISADEFYARLKGIEKLPTTSCPSPQQMLDAFNASAEKGAEDVIVITISSAISGTFNVATLTSPDSPIPVHVVDSKSASLGIGLVIDAAVKLRDRGYSASEIVERLREIVSALRVYFIVDNLENLVKGGRANKAAGLASSILDIKPILTFDEDGKIVPFKKFKGRKKAFAGMTETIREYGTVHGPIYFAPIFTQDPEDHARIRSSVEASGLDAIELFSGQVGPCVGVHAPEAAAIAFYPRELLDRE